MQFIEVHEPLVDTGVDISGLEGLSFALNSSNLTLALFSLFCFILLAVSFPTKLD